MTARRTFQRADLSKRRWTAFGLAVLGGLAAVLGANWLPAHLSPWAFGSAGALFTQAAAKILPMVADWTFGDDPSRDNGGWPRAD